MKMVYQLAIAALILCGCGNNNQCSSQQETITPVLVSPYEVGQPFAGSDGKYHMVYGLRLTNCFRQPATIEKIEIFNTEAMSTPLLTLEGTELLFFMEHLDSQSVENATIERDGSRMLFIVLAFENSAIPSSLSHRVSVKADERPDSKEPSAMTYTAANLTVPKQGSLVLSPPLKGKGWTVFNGCCTFRGGHQRTLLPINGDLYNSQRYAIDFMKLNEQNKLVEGDPTIAENWVCYNEKVYAVADGTVVEVLEGLPDQTPGKLPDPSTITLHTIGGNHVVLKLDDCLYAYYAHLKNGTIQVKAGDRVKKGDFLGHVGNSGNTSAPHLHLHLMHSMSPVGSSPVVYLYDHFTLTGQIDTDVFYTAETLQGSYGNRDTFTPKACNKQLPLDLNIVDF